MRILIADSHPDTSASAVSASVGAPHGNHRLGASTVPAIADEVVRLPGAVAGGRLLHGVYGVPEAVPDPHVDAAVRS